VVNDQWSTLNMEVFLGKQSHTRGRTVSGDNLAQRRWKEVARVQMPHSGLLGY